MRQGVTSKAVEGIEIPSLGSQPLCIGIGKVCCCVGLG